MQVPTGHDKIHDQYFKDCQDHQNQRNKTVRAEKPKTTWQISMQWYGREPPRTSKRSNHGNVNKA